MSDRRRLPGAAHARRLLPLLCALSSAGAWALEYRLNPVADTSIFGEINGGTGADGLSDAAGQSLWVSTTAGGVARRALLRFDLSAVPAGEQVLSASLSLYESRSRDNHVVNLHRVLAAWGEGASNGGDAGAGAAAQPGDATWRWNNWQVSEWATRGGEFSAAASSSLLVGDPNQFYTWSSTPSMVADVQGWLAAPQDNFGWILVGNELTSLNAKRFDSSEAGVIAQRPLLVLVTQPVPEPATWLLAGLGLSVVGWAARRRR